MLIPVSKLMKLRFDWIQKMAYFGLINNKNAMKFILTILISIMSVGLFAQGSSQSGDCYQEWFTFLKSRGTKAVPNGTNDVIISIRHGEYSECFMGKVDVKDGRLTGKLQIQKIDGTYAEFDKKVNATYQDKTGVLKEELRDIYNGMSAALTLTDGETIRLFFYQSVLETTKANKKAPSPSELIKN